MSDKIILLIISTFLGIAGFCIIGYNSNWYVASGIFVMLFGNNIEQADRFIKK